MLTECNQESLQFHPLFRREVRGQFDGGVISSDAGGLLLREVEKRTRIVAQFAACFRDHRDLASVPAPSWRDQTSFRRPSCLVVRRSG